MTQTYRMRYSNLSVSVLDDALHKMHAPYWYIVYCGSTNHLAFKTREGFDRWLFERGLFLADELPLAGDAGSTRIIGEYYDISHWETEPNDGESIPPMVEGDFYAQMSARNAIMLTMKMDNGRYTLAIITEENGVRSVHYLNVNVKTRVEFNPATARQLLGM